MFLTKTKHFYIIIIRCIFLSPCEQWFKSIVREEIQVGENFFCRLGRSLQQFAGRRGETERDTE